MSLTPPPVRVYLDTSTIRGASHDAGYKSLIDLAGAKLVDLQLSRVAFEELRTQWREDRASDLLKARQALRKLAVDKHTSPAQAANYSKMLDDLPAVADLEAWSHDAMPSRLGTSKFTVLEVDPGDAGAALASYFAGSPPFKAVKSREDLPDAFIFEAARRAAAAAGGHPFIAVVADNTLRKALADSGLTALGTLKALFELPEIAERVDHLKDAALWADLKAKLDEEALREELAEWVQDNYRDLLNGVRLRLSGVGLSENYPLEIDCVESLEDGPEFGPIEDYGGGWLSVPVTVGLDVSVSFMIYRADAFDAPSWVSVEIGDFDDDVYFDASGTVRVHVETDLAVKLDLAGGLEEGNQLVASVEAAKPTAYLQD